jgi:hypothetical protein
MYGDENQSSKRKRDDIEDASSSPSEADHSNKASKTAHTSHSPSEPNLHSLSSDDAAIEAAIAVALQLACHTTSAEQILQVRLTLSLLFSCVYSRLSDTVTLR